MQVKPQLLAQFNNSSKFCKLNLNYLHNSTIQQFKQILQVKPQLLAQFNNSSKYFQQVLQFQQVQNMQQIQQHKQTIQFKMQPK